MPNTKSAEKRSRQSNERRLKNRAVRTNLKTQVKKIREAVAAKDSTKAEEEARATQAKLDRAAARGIIHRNAAARSKSRIQRLLKSAKSK